MKAKLLLLAAVLLAAVSCDEEALKQLRDETYITCDFSEEVSNAKEYFDDSEAATRYWSEGDQIAINDVKGNTRTITLVSSGEASFDQGLISSDHKTFTFLRDANWSSVVYAVYPACAFVSLTGKEGEKHPVITFANQDGTFSKAHICAAKIVDNKLHFKSAGAIIMYHYKPMEMMNLTIPYSGLSSSSSVSFSSDGTPSLAEYERDIENTFNVISGEVDTFIGVPTGVIPSGTEIVYRTSSRAVMAKYKTKADVKLSRSAITRMDDIVYNNDSRFSVSDKTKVCFAGGNLYCKRTSSSSDDWTWGIYEHQYDMNSLDVNCDKEGYRTAQASDTEKDLFTWGCASTDPVENTLVPYSSFSNWGKVFGDNYSWRVLTENEWVYLCNKRSASTLNGVNNARYCIAKVNNVEGVMFFPDIWKQPENVAVPVASSINANQNSNVLSIYTSAEWQSLEEAGAVFLPAAGNRDAYRISSIGTSGSYWSSSLHHSSSNTAFLFEYDNFVNPLFPYAILVDPEGYTMCHYGASVRFVTPASY